MLNRLFGGLISIVVSFAALAVVVKWSPEYKTAAQPAGWTAADIRSQGVTVTLDTVERVPRSSAAVTSQPRLIWLMTFVNGAPLTAPSTITISATAFEPDGLEGGDFAFYQDATLIGTDMASPYSVTWNNVAAGTYALAENPNGLTANMSPARYQSAPESQSHIERIGNNAMERVGSAQEPGFNVTGSPAILTTAIQPQMIVGKPAMVRVRLSRQPPQATQLMHLARKNAFLVVMLSEYVTVDLAVPADDFVVTRLSERDQRLIHACEFMFQIVPMRGGEVPIRIKIASRFYEGERQERTEQILEAGMISIDGAAWRAIGRSISQQWISILSLPLLTLLFKLAIEVLRKKPLEDIKM